MGPLVAGRVGAGGRRIDDFDDHATLDAVVTGIGHVEVALAVDDHAVVVEELPGIGAVGHAALTWARARRVLVHRRAVRGELDHPPVVRIRNVHVAVAIHGNAAGQVDLAGAVAFGAKLPEHRAIRRELLDAVVAPIRNVHIALLIEGDGLRNVELARVGALAAEDLLDFAVRTVARDRVRGLVEDVDVVAGAVYGDADRGDHPAWLAHAVAALPRGELLAARREFADLVE